MATQSPATFDPGQQIPEAYDVFCEACGYSLAGLAGERCPECGAAFDPTGLPFARIPWLHRRRLGKVKAYFTTIFLVCFHPARFARELCRPVRISAADAKSFRLTTIWLVTAMFGLIVGGAPVVVLYQLLHRSILPPDIVNWIIFASAGVMAACAMFHIFLRLATDMPLFIWKGIPSMAPSELAPIHHYAAAPLVVVLILTPIAAYLLYVQANSISFQEDFYSLAYAAMGIIPLIWLWAVAVILMRVSTNANNRRLALLAGYLPAHWLMMAAMSVMLFAVIVQIGHFLFWFFG